MWKKGPKSEHPNKQIMQFLRCFLLDDVWHFKKGPLKINLFCFLRTQTIQHHYFWFYPWLEWKNEIERIRKGLCFNLRTKQSFNYLFLAFILPEYPFCDVKSHNRIIFHIYYIEHCSNICVHKLVINNLWSLLPRDFLLMIYMYDHFSIILSSY